MPRGSKGVIIHSELKCFKINPALWEAFKVKCKGKTAARLRKLILMDLKTEEK